MHLFSPVLLKLRYIYCIVHVWEKILSISDVHLIYTIFDLLSPLFNTFFNMIFFHFTRVYFTVFKTQVSTSFIGVCPHVLKPKFVTQPLEGVMHRKLDWLTLCASGLVLRLPLSRGCNGGTGGTGWVKRSRLCLLYCRAQSHTEGRGGSEGSEEEPGWSMSLQPFTGV